MPSNECPRRGRFKTANILWIKCSGPEGDSETGLTFPWAMSLLTSTNPNTDWENLSHKHLPQLETTKSIKFSVRSSKKATTVIIPSQAFYFSSSQELVRIPKGFGWACKFLSSWERDLCSFVKESAVTLRCTVRTRVVTVPLHNRKGETEFWSPATAIWSPGH